MLRFGIIAENFKFFENDIFDCKVLWVVGKCEWNFVGFFVVKFVVRSLGRLLGRGVCLLLQRSQGSRVF